MTNNAGLYLHIPFCEKKCKYCDFYSSFVTEELLEGYTNALIEAIKKWGGNFNRPIDTIYLGGGTPSLLGSRLPKVLNAVRSNFFVVEPCEITLELNPAGNINTILEYAKQAGVNRLSVGMQSALDSELKVLGRTHTVKDTVNTVSLARNRGFQNISLDIMIGLPFSSNDTIKQSLELLKELSPEHISAYILKIEQNTAFFREKENLELPDDDSIAEQYIYMCEFLENNGYSHYEISNFCKTGNHSKHNIKYWQLNEYLGIGPAAHSFVDGKRFYYPRDLKAFLKGNEPIFDSDGGNAEEYIMLKLRLKEGFSVLELKEKFGIDFSVQAKALCELYQKAGLVNINKNTISLTNKGMLLSNTIISEILDCI